MLLGVEPHHVDQHRPPAGVVDLSELPLRAGEVLGVVLFELEEAAGLGQQLRRRLRQGGSRADRGEMSRWSISARRALIISPNSWWCRTSSARISSTR